MLTHLDAECPAVESIADLREDVQRVVNDDPSKAPSGCEPALGDGTENEDGSAACDGGVGREDPAVEFSRDTDVGAGGTGTSDVPGESSVHCERDVSERLARREWRTYLRRRARRPGDAQRQQQFREDAPRTSWIRKGWKGCKSVVSTSSWKTAGRVCALVDEEERGILVNLGLERLEIDLPVLLGEQVVVADRRLSGGGQRLVGGEEGSREEDVLARVGENSKGLRGTSAPAPPLLLSEPHAPCPEHPKLRESSRRPGA